MGKERENDYPTPAGGIVALRTLGAILAGGASSRFGSDKALAPLAGRPLIAHARDAISGAVDAVIVCGREWDGLVSVADVPGPGLGPLGGIAAALSYAEAEGFDSVLTISCDMPDIPKDLLAALLAHAPSYCPEAPVLGHWPGGLACGLVAHLRSALLCAADGKVAGASIRVWAQSVGATPIPSPIPLRNINRPADLLA